MIGELRRDSSGEIFSYTFLMDHLQGYANPDGKIGRMIKSGEIIRVKKGLYVFGEEYRNGLIDRVILANLIYGPSYVSGLYALSQHGLIPERVETITSMTTQRKKEFTTPFGRFEYLHLNRERYTVGVDWRQESSLIASPEKALADVVARERDLKSIDELAKLLVESLRIDEESLTALDLQRMTKIGAVYGNPTVRLLRDFLARMS